MDLAARAAGHQAVEMHVDLLGAERGVDELDLLAASRLHRVGRALVEVHDLEQRESPTRGRGNTLIRTSGSAQALRAARPISTPRSAARATAPEYMSPAPARSASGCRKPKCCATPPPCSRARSRSRPPWWGRPAV